MAEQRLIDANCLDMETEESLRKNPHTESMRRAMHTHEHNHFLCMIAHQPTIDPETLPVVLQLREELARVTAERDAIKKNPPVEIQADAFVLAVELAKVTAERDAAVEDLKKWNVCATCENYRPKSRTSNCKIKKAYLSGGNWAGCSRWEWRGPQEEE